MYSKKKQRKMVYKNNFLSEERPFNFAELLLNRCNELFVKANESGVEGDALNWYRVLTRIKTAISFVLEEKELTEVEMKLKKTRVNIDIMLKKRLPYDFQVEDSLDDIEKSLVKLMYKYELYYPHYSKRTWQEKAKGEDV